MKETQSETGVEVSAEKVAKQDMEAYNANDPLIELLAPEGKLKLLLVLIRMRGDKVNPAGLCERAAVDRATWYRHRDDLLDTYGVIEEAGQMGNSPLYRVDMDHPIVKRLDEIRDLATEQRNRATDPDRE
jgi:hypothetical protein